MVATLLLPLLSSNFISTLQDEVARMLVRALFGGVASIAMRRNRHSGIAASNDLVALKGVVGSVARHLFDIATDAIEQAGQNIAVAIVMGRHFCHQNLTAGFINSKMQLSPGTPLVDAMLLGLPFAGSAAM